MAASDICVTEYGGRMFGSLLRVGNNEFESSVIRALPATASSCECGHLVLISLFIGTMKVKSLYLHHRVERFRFIRVIIQTESFKEF